MSNSVNDRICVALDFPTRDEAMRVAQELRDVVGIFKVGLELFSAAGPQIVRDLVSSGCPIFLDLKFHDIPNTVGGAARQVAALGCSFFNVHASGGSAMMRAAADAANSASPAQAMRPVVIAVTVLTSLNETMYSDEVLGRLSIRETALRYAILAKEAGLSGVVASPHEVAEIKATCGKDFLTVVPGVRPEWAAGASDQQRVMTPEQAVRAGADILVIGRPITGAKDRKDAAKRIGDEIHGAMR